MSLKRALKTGRIRRRQCVPGLYGAAVIVGGSLIRSQGQSGEPATNHSVPRRRCASNCHEPSQQPMESLCRRSTGGVIHSTLAFEAVVKAEATEATAAVLETASPTAARHTQPRLEVKVPTTRPSCRPGDNLLWTG